MNEPDPMLGTMVAGRYRVTGVLGEGGMGVVYEARQEELDRSVAVKVMRPEYASDPRVVERFVREAKAVGALGHPNIVDVYDVGRMPDGRPYMVMPRLEGEDLSAFLVEGTERLAPARVAELLEGPAAALDLVHARGMVHRDLKPENLIHVRLASGQEVVKLVDFGLAALLDQPRSRLTRAGTITGTPQYMSPESTGGALADGRGDVYALAVIAFELMTGHLPFDDPDPVRTLIRKRDELAPRLATFGLAASPALEAVMARGLERDPKARYPSAGELVTALRHAAQIALDASADTDVEAAVLPGGARIWPWAAAIGGVAVLVAAGAWFAAVPEGTRGAQSGDDRWEPRPANAADARTPVVAEPELELDVDPAPLEPEPIAEVPAVATTPAEPEPSEPPQARRPRARPDPAPVVEVVRPPADDDRARALVDEGTSALLRGRVPSAIDSFRAATQASARHAPAWRGLGLAYERLGRRAEAARAYRRYLDLAPGAADAATLRARASELERPLPNE